MCRTAGRRCPSCGGPGGGRTVIPVSSATQVRKRVSTIKNGGKVPFDVTIFDGKTDAEIMAMWSEFEGKPYEENPFLVGQKQPSEPRSVSPEKKTLNEDRDDLTLSRKRLTDSIKSPNTPQELRAEVLSEVARIDAQRERVKAAISSLTRQEARARSEDARALKAESHARTRHGDHSKRKKLDDLYDMPKVKPTSIDDLHVTQRQKLAELTLSDVQKSSQALLELRALSSKYAKRLKKEFDPATRFSIQADQIVLQPVRDKLRDNLATARRNLRDLEKSINNDEVNAKSADAEPYTDGKFANFPSVYDIYEKDMKHAEAEKRAMVAKNALVQPAPFVPAKKVEHVKTIKKSAAPARALTREEREEMTIKDNKAINDARAELSDLQKEHRALIARVKTEIRGTALPEKLKVEGKMNELRQTIRDLEDRIVETEKLVVADSAPRQ
jgi:hypothetical protein